MKKLESTPRDNIKVKYYFNTKKGKTVVKAQLTDDFGCPIEGADATYTKKELDTEEVAKLAARTRAFQKLDDLFSVEKIDGGQVSDFFSRRWTSLSDREKKECIEASHREGKTLSAAISYFENHVLGQLDAYGPGITDDQAQAIVDSLFNTMLKKKKFNAYLVNRDTVPCTQEFFEVLRTALRKDKKKLRQLFGHNIDLNEADMLLTKVEEVVVSEDRLRSLVEVWLQNQKVEAGVQTFRDKVENDAVLLDCLDNKNKYDMAIERIVQILRILSGNEVQTKNQVNSHVRDVNTILEKMALFYDEMPVVTLPQYIVEKAPQIETCKELPWAVRRSFLADCLRQARTNSYACGGITMDTCGPRVEEVCAIKIGDILDMGDWGVAVINYTVDGDILAFQGKNSYFRRPIFFPRVSMTAIKWRKESLEEQGYTPDQIAQAFLVSRPNDPFAPASLHQFSRHIKGMLQAAGCAENFWNAVQLAMVAEPDLDFWGRPERYAVAYCLRRDATSMLCNIARMNPLLVDAILGHRLPRYAPEWNEKIKHEDMWPEIIAQMERVVYDPVHTANPAFSSIRLGERLGLQAHGLANQAFSLTADKRCKVVLSVRTVGNSNVRYQVPASSQQKGTIVSLTGMNRPYRGLSPLPPKEDFDKIN